MHFRIRFYSDDSYSPCGHGRFHAVVAGVAIQADRSNVHRNLLDAERSSCKRLLDWHKTSRESRERYIDAVLAISYLQARVFYCPFDSLANHEYPRVRAETLAAAIAVFTPGRCHHRIAHEGLQSRPRQQLRLALLGRGCERVTVESAQFFAEPEVRLSDALAGYIRGELYRDEQQRAALTNLPDLFVNLEAKIRNPPE